MKLLRKDVSFKKQLNLKKNLKWSVIATMLNKKWRKKRLFRRPHLHMPPFKNRVAIQTRSLRVFGRVIARRTTNEVRRDEVLPVTNADLHPSKRINPRIENRKSHKSSLKRTQYPTNLSRVLILTTRKQQDENRLRFKNALRNLRSISTNSHHLTSSSLSSKSSTQTWTTSASTLLLNSIL